MHKQKVYLLSGLGADRRVFEKLTLPGERIYIHWIAPLEDENLQHYCMRLIKIYIIETNQVLLGVSLGGILAVELSKLISAKKVIIISSVKSSQEMPLLFRLTGYLHVYKFLPYSLLKKPTILLRFAFSPISSEDYVLLKKIVADTDVRFLKWAIKQILLWKAGTPTSKVIHLHGTSDKIFPFRNSHPSIPITNGGHFMVYNRAAEVSEIIRQFLVRP